MLAAGPCRRAVLIGKDRFVPDLQPEDAKLVTLARSARGRTGAPEGAAVRDTDGRTYLAATVSLPRSEEHTSELQSRQYLVCRLLLEKKKKSPSRLPTCSNTMP